MFSFMDVLVMQMIEEMLFSTKKSRVTHELANVDRAISCTATQEVLVAGEPHYYLNATI